MTHFQSKLEKIPDESYQQKSERRDKPLFDDFHIHDNDRLWLLFVGAKDAD
jgi:hypothetical protein